MQKVYFDNAATTQLSSEVISKMIEVMSSDYGNPSSTHAFGRTAKNHIEQARKNIAKYLGVHASEIIFTSGGTEADNLVLNSAVRDMGVQRIITSKIEHHAVLHTAQKLASKTSIVIEYVQILKDGSIDYDHLETLLAQKERKTLLSLMHVNNEIGTILDIHRVSNLCREYQVLFHSDMVQSIGHLPVDLAALQIDFAAASAHKFHGPKGIGFAYVKKNSGIKPLIYGGEQERGYRGGTESVHNIVGMDEALRLALIHLEKEKEYIVGIKNYFIEQLQLRLPMVQFNARCQELDHSTYTLINVLLPISESKAAMVLFQLDIKGIACSKGSACQSGSGKGSHVLAEFLSIEEQKQPSIRFSFSKYNTKEDVDYTIRVLEELLIPVVASE